MRQGCGIEPKGNAEAWGRFDFLLSGTLRNQSWSAPRKASRICFPSTSKEFSSNLIVSRCRHHQVKQRAQPGLVGLAFGGIKNRGENRVDRLEKGIHISGYPIQLKQRSTPVFAVSVVFGVVLDDYRRAFGLNGIPAEQGAHLTKQIGIRTNAQ